MSPRAAIVAGLLLAVVAASSAGADPPKGGSGVERSALLWATVNVCDPVDPPKELNIGPNTIGIRASMPGARDGRELMYMQFRVQFFSDADMKWHNTKGGASAWKQVGPARYKARQAGRYFRLSPPDGKPSLMLRGKVNFEWRLKGEVVRKAVKITTKGHRSSVGAFPAGFSEATCTITA